MANATATTAVTRVYWRVCEGSKCKSHTDRSYGGELLNRTDVNAGKGGSQGNVVTTSSPVATTTISQGGGGGSSSTSTSTPLQSSTVNTDQATSSLSPSSSRTTTTLTGGTTQPRTTIIVPVMTTTTLGNVFTTTPSPQERLFAGVSWQHSFTRSLQSTAATSAPLNKRRVRSLTTPLAAQADGSAPSMACAKVRFSSFWVEEKCSTNYLNTSQGIRTTVL